MISAYAYTTTSVIRDRIRSYTIVYDYFIVDRRRIDVDSTSVVAIVYDSYTTRIRSSTIEKKCLTTFTNNDNTKLWRQKIRYI